MAIEQNIEKYSKLLALLTDFVKFSVLATVCAFAIAAVAFPAWAQKRLKALNLQVKEINIAGVKLVANETFDMANTLVDARISLESAANQLAAGGGANEGVGATATAVKEALQNISVIQSALARQDSAIKETTKHAGLPEAEVPAAGWVYVGRLSDTGQFMPGPRIDPKETVVSKGKLTRLQLKYDAPIVTNGNQCERTAVADFHPPSSEERQRIHVLLSADSRTPQNVLETSECPSAGNGKWLYAKVEIRKEHVRFVKFAELPG